MNSLRSVLILGVLSSALTVGAGCGEEPDDPALEQPSSQVEDVVSGGSIEDGTYTNTVLGLQIRIPEGWEILDYDSITKAAEVGAEMAGDTEETAIDVGKMTLLATSRYPMDEPVGFNPNLALVIMDGVAVDPSLDSGIELARLEKEYVDGGGMPGYVVGEIRTEDISGQSFGVLVFDKTVFDHLQKKYITVIDEYVLITVLTYSTDDELAELDAMVATMTID